MVRIAYLMKKSRVILFAAVLFFVASVANAKTIPVTFENYVEAQTSMQMNDYQKLAKGVNKWYNFKMPISIDNQPTIRMNRDTLYSMAVVNVSQGAIITLPDADKRYMSLLVCNEYGYVQQVLYGKGKYTFTKESIGSNYALFIVRTLVVAGDSVDIAIVNALQDKLTIEAKDNTPYTMPDWDEKSFKKVYEPLVALFGLMSDTQKTFGKKGEVDPIRFLLGAAGGFGGLPDKDAIYMNVFPEQGKNFKITFKRIPVDGLWSFTVYDKEGYLFNSQNGLSSINNLVAKPSEDGTYTIYFGNCEEYQENCLATEDGWNFALRLFQPHGEIITGAWSMPPLEVSQ